GSALSRIAKRRKVRTPSIRRPAISRLKKDPPIRIDLTDRLDGPLIKRMEPLHIKTSRVLALEFGIDCLQRIEHRAGMRLVHDVVTEYGGMAPKTLGKPLERSEIVRLQIRVLAFGIRPEIIESSLHRRLKVVREPTRLLNERLPIVANRPFGCAIAAKP